jgi:hypothetical protein
MRPVADAVFDEPNLVSAVGLVPVVALAHDAGLRALADEHLSVPTDKGANAGLKVASLVAGMVAGADSIDDMALLRHGAWARSSRPVAANAAWLVLAVIAFNLTRAAATLTGTPLARTATATIRRALIDVFGHTGRLRGIYFQRMHASTNFATYGLHA